MPVTSIIADSEKIEVRDGAAVFRLDLAEFAGDPARNAETVRQRLQDFFDTRIVRADLVDGDPVRNVDPDRDEFHWDGSDVVSRSVVVADVVWDGTTYALTLETARGSGKRSVRL